MRRLEFEFSYFFGVTPKIPLLLKVLTTSLGLDRGLSSFLSMAFQMHSAPLGRYSTISQFLT